MQPNSSGVTSAVGAGDGAAFLEACHTGDVLTAESLLMELPALLRYADPDTGGGGATGLWLAAEDGHAEIARLILSHLHPGEVGDSGDDANGAAARLLTLARQPEGATPLYIAAQNGSVAVVAALCEFLRSRCGDGSRWLAVNTPKATGATPLYIAAQQGCLPVVEELLRCGADAESATIKGLTPLMIAAYQGQVGCVAALLASGASAGARAGQQGRTALDWATAGAAKATGAAAGADYDRVAQLLAGSSRSAPVAAAPISAATPAPAETAPRFTRAEIDAVTAEWAVFRAGVAQEARHL